MLVGNPFIAYFPQKTFKCERKKGKSMEIYSVRRIDEENT